MKTKATVLALALYLLSTCVGAAELVLDDDGILSAIEYGRSFNSQYAAIATLDAEGYSKGANGWYVFREFFLITDFVRVAAHSAEAKRRGKAVEVEEMRQLLSGKLGILVFYDADYGHLPKKPVLSVKTTDGILYAERTIKISVYRDCDVSLPSTYKSKLYLDFSEFCEINTTLGIIKDEISMWLFTFSILPEHWKSKIQLLLAEDSGKVAKKKFDLARIR